MHHIHNLFLILALFILLMGPLGCSKPIQQATAPDSKAQSPPLQAEKQDDTTASPQAPVATAHGSVAEAEHAPSTPATADVPPATDTNSPRQQENARTTNGQRHPRVAGGRSTAASVAYHTSDGDPNYKPPADPRAAQAQAERSLTDAQQSASKGNYGTAYQTALNGWQQANTYAKQDQKCRKLSQQLLDLLEQYGDQANRAAGATHNEGLRSKILILK